MHIPTHLLLPLILLLTTSLTTLTSAAALPPRDIPVINEYQKRADPARVGYHAAAAAAPEGPVAQVRERGW